jgi:type I restriction enzyme S subunit
MASEYVSRGIPFLRSQNVEPLRINFEDTKYVSPAFHVRLRKSALRPGDVVIVRTGKPGACAVVPTSLPDANCSDLVIVRCGPRIDPRFLAYYVNSSAAHHVASHLVGAVQQHFNVGAARKMQMLLPDLSEQRAIAHILGSLDDKIELNRRLNETLEALARAIFDDMFGDKTPNAVVGDLADIERDSVSPMEHKDELFDHFSLPAFDEARRPVRECGGSIKSNKFVVRAGAVLLSKLNPAIPRVWYPRVRREPRSIASTEFQVMRPRMTSSPEFLYCLLRSEPVRDHLVGLASGTSNSHQRVKPDDLLATPAPMPSANSLDSFTRTARPMLERVNASIDESASLAALRDALLPKLLSGELRIPDAEKLVEAAT